jgi:hypothetical protein
MCNQCNLLPELPDSINEFRRIIKPHNAIIGVIPLEYQVIALKDGKTVIVIEMDTIGCLYNKKDAIIIASQYPGVSVVLSPSEEGGKHKVMLYKGMKLIKEVKVVDEWVVQHSG